MSAGFMCVVQGKVDFSDFFYGMHLCFDKPPPLSVLKRAIEERVMDDSSVAEGSDYIVSDIEILDFRCNLWVNLESRGQLYSGCHLAAIRDTISSSCTGPVEVPKKRLPQKLLGFSLSAQRIFETLDVDGEGVLRLKGVLKAFRNDINYAVDAFGKLDSKCLGVVNYQDFMSVFHSLPKSFFSEMQERLLHGGAKPAGDSGQTPRGGDDHRADQQQPRSPHVTGSTGGAHFDADSSSPKMDLLAIRGKYLSKDTLDLKDELADNDSTFGKAVSEKPSEPTPQSSAAVQKVVDILQSVTRKKEPSGKLSPAMLGRIKGAARKAVSGSSGGAQQAASPLGAAPKKR